MKLKLLVTAILLISLGINIADAQHGRRVQRHRIHEGLRSGELTRAETRNLALRQRHLNRNIRRAHADGVVTRRERRMIRMERRHQSRAIFRKRHNLRQPI